MVHSVGVTQAARGPTLTQNQTRSVRINLRNQETFLDKLRSGTRAFAGMPGGSEAPLRPTDDGGQAVAQMFPRPEAEEAPWAALAPGEQSVLGGPGSVEVGQLLALFGPSPEPVPATAQGQQHPGVADVSVLVERWVRRVALGGDQRRGVAKLDIGAGRFAGAELIVVAEAAKVEVELSLPAGVDNALAERLRSRLKRRGFDAEVVVR
jgi:hypothetical protein